MAPIPAAQTTVISKPDDYSVKFSAWIFFSKKHTELQRVENAVPCLSEVEGGFVLWTSELEPISLAPSGSDHK